MILSDRLNASPAHSVGSLFLILFNIHWAQDGGCASGLFCMFSFFGLVLEILHWPLLLNFVCSIAVVVLHMHIVYLYFYYIILILYDICCHSIDFSLLLLHAVTFCTLIFVLPAILFTTISSTIVITRHCSLIGLADYAVLLNVILRIGCCSPLSSGELQCVVSLS